MVLAIRDIACCWRSRGRSRRDIGLAWRPLLDDVVANVGAGDAGVRHGCILFYESLVYDGSTRPLHMHNRISLEWSVQGCAPPSRTLFLVTRLPRHLHPAAVFLINNYFIPSAFITESEYSESPVTQAPSRSPLVSKYRWMALLRRDSHTDTP
jgi:hypothetical protein